MPTSYIALPAHHDHVGSLLRPAQLLLARGQHLIGATSASALKREEDKHIREAIDLQQSVGLLSITDGEFRRGSAQNDFFMQLHGIRTEFPVRVVAERGRIRMAPPVMRVVDRIQRKQPVLRPIFEFLQSQIAPGHTAKITIPSPLMLHFRGGRAGISPEAYPNLEPDFYDDLVNVYVAELQSLGDAGCRYVQFDATDLGYLCDAQMREAARQRGEDPDTLPWQYARLMNRIVERKPAGMLLALHICRGNFRSTWAATGGYEPVAEAVLQGMEMDAYFLEYDDARSGGFEPLRYLPPGKTAVLGLVGTKTGALESSDALARRIDEAAKHAPLSQLALSPQCGFASTYHGNHLGVDEQRAKLELVVETARRVWG